MQSSSPLTGVAAAMAVLTSAASAAVQVYTPNPVHVSDRAVVNFATIDPVTPNITNVSSGGVFYFCLNSNFANVYLVSTGEYDVLFMPTDSFRVQRLDSGAEIGDSTIGTDDYVVSIDNVDYTFGEKFFVGFGFRERETGNDYNYGWAEVSFADDGDLSIYRIGYETDAGVSITTGVVPEPSSALLAATGLLALAGRRKR
jgi:hypothetical protein